VLVCRVQVREKKSMPLAESSHESQWEFSVICKLRYPYAAAVLLLAASFAMHAQKGPAAGSACAVIPHGDHPTAYLTNGEVDLVVFLPDAANGYYRSSRFDWSGIVACASYRGHTYFGEWFDRYDPLTNDAVTGPAEEFRADEGKEIGYAEAPVGGEFLKPGVGVLKKISDKPYQFGTFYPIVDHGEWTVKQKGRSLVFTQRLQSKIGFAYLYTKTIELDAHKPVFKLKHSLTNLGTKPIDTNVYDHDFFMLDHKPTGKQDQVTMGFTPVAEKPLGEAAEVRGNTIAFTMTPDREHAAAGDLKGFTGRPGEYRAHLVDTESGVGILQSSASPISRFYFWSTSKTICPELYIPVHVAPGRKQMWEIRYQLEVPVKSKHP
jgi:hypothetical protein